MARMRQLTVADDYAEPAGCEIAKTPHRGGIDDAGEAHRVGRPSPALPAEGDAERCGPVDVRELVGLDIAAGIAHAGKDAEIGRDLLLEPDCKPIALAVAADWHRIDGTAGRERTSDRILEPRHAPATLEGGHEELARLTEQLVPMLELQIDLILVAARLERRTVGYIREVEHAGARGPGARVPLERAPDGVAPCIRRVVEGARIDHG